MTYAHFEDIPNALRQRILKLGLKDIEKWIHSKLPALDQRSIMEILNVPGGEERVRLMLDQIGEFHTYE